VAELPADQAVVFGLFRLSLAFTDRILAGDGPFPDLCRLHGLRDVAWLLSAHRIPEWEAQ
jgi:hypothetical protein